MTITPTDHVLALLATPEPFRAWLLSHPPGALVGRRAEACQCPVARYLLRSGIDAHVYSNQIEFSGDNGPGEIKTPEWARMFILLIDRGAAEDQLNVSRVVTRDEALAALKEAP